MEPKSEQLFKDRLRILVNKVGSGEKLAKLAGTSGRSIGKYLSGDSLPGLEALVSIASAAGYSVEWLATGNGPALASDKLASPSPVDPDKYVFVPHYQIKGDSCDPYAKSGVEAGSLFFEREWIQQMGLVPEKLALVTTKGDSMKPTLSDGDVLLVDLRQTGITDGAIHVMRTDGHLLIKRLQLTLSDRVIVRSDSPDFSQFEANHTELTVVGRVVWRGGKI